MGRIEAVQGYRVMVERVVMVVMLVMCVRVVMVVMFVMCVMVVMGVRGCWQPDGLLQWWRWL